MTAFTVYGIPNCDTVRKARAWLEANAVAYDFHDYKKQGVPVDALKKAASALGFERLVNRQGQTWRKLPDAEKNTAMQEAGAFRLMEAQPSVIRRPLVMVGKEWLAGFDESAWRAAFGRAA